MRGGIWVEFRAAIAPGSPGIAPTVLPPTDGAKILMDWVGGTPWII